MRKQLSRFAIVLAVLYASFAAFIWWSMRQSPETFGRVMSRLPGVAYVLVPFETMWTHARAGQLHPGDSAPDFSLVKLDKTATVQLSSLTAQKPVVLLFGSYT
ncbi:MAG: hypothetical protein LAO24_22150 [Acidobacteriia bacterium]|nr:hypothetical protein [Terriglobia bacterium]